MTTVQTASDSQTVAAAKGTALGEMGASMKVALRVLFLELMVIVAAAALISGTYIFVLAEHQRTYTVMIVGLTLSGLASGYVVYRAGFSTRTRRWLAAVGIGVAVTIITLNLFLFILVNTLGA